MRRSMERRYWMTLVAGAVLLLAVVYVSLTNGVFNLTVTDVIKTLLRIDPVHEHDMVVFEFRLPRIVIAAFVGFGLGIAGTVVQGITKNGLADPGILGINAGAGFAGVLFMLLFEGKMIGASLLSIMAMPMFGLAGGLMAAGFIYLFAWRNGRLEPGTLILVGIAVGSGLSAATIYLSLKMNPQDYEMAAVWLTGSIWNANWNYVLSMIPWFLLLVPVVFRKAPILDVLQLGEESVKGLGVRTEKEKSVLLIASIGLVSACVSVSGSIGFVGLLSPHIAKRLVGLHHRRVMPISGLVGMLLVVISDFIAKTVFSPAELPVGIVISIVGVPYFVYLLFRAKM
ncbi:MULTISPECIES: iron ABC transporter permease [unclassified Brevibacillus]|jgi:iron complex transport system permease protein|uniref:FecCD family ABC transporter permease n=2 Tax=Brevibacillus TaxID=55080 RepID=UPI001491F34A|nr:MULTISPECIES: iron ABC transporter permease [unclassified Brevibacillus]NNV01757.1 iron ABC transporter permease [Brevibacillus sp. MCWH]